MRYFYTDISEATIMFTKHRFKFKTALGQNMYWTGGEFRTEKDCGVYGGEKYYIHPLCHKLLSPQEGDLVRLFFYTKESDNNANAAMTAVVWGNGVIARTWFRDGRDGSINYQEHNISDHTYEIIQRNGKAFFTPESEA